MSPGRVAARPTGLLELELELGLQGCPLIGSAEKRATSHSSPYTAPENVSNSRVPRHLRAERECGSQGRKEVQIGKDTLPTTLPVPAHLGGSANCNQSAEASENSPCLAVAMKIDLSIIREDLSRDEFP